MSTAEESFSKSCGIFQAFGLIYFSIKKLSRKTVNKFPTLYFTIYFVTILTLLTSQIVYFIYALSLNIDEEPLSAKNALNYLLRQSMFFGLILIFWVALIQSYTVTPQLKKIILNFIEISNSFRRDFQHNVDYKSSQKWMFKFILFMCVYYFVAHTGLACIELYKGETLGSVIMGFMLSIIPITFMDIIVVKFVFFVKNVNEILRAMTIVIDETFQKYETSKIVVISENIVTLNVDEKIRNLRKICNLVYQNVELINKSMKYTTLTKFFVLVLVALTTCYNMFLVFVGKIPADELFGKFN